MQPPELLLSLALDSFDPGVINALLSQRSAWLNISLALNKNLTVPQRNQLLAVANSDPRLESQLISHLAFTELLLPKLLQLGAPALQLFFSLAYGWHASVADLLQTTENSLSA